MMTYQQWLKKFPLPQNYRAETMAVTTDVINRCRVVMADNRTTKRRFDYVEEIARIEWALRQSVI